MKELTLTNGYVTLLDDDDYEWASQYRWCGQASKLRRVIKRYAVRCHCDSGKQFAWKLHRMILNAPKGLVVDHINGDGLDNRKCNLRLCDWAQNTWNMEGRAASGYKGVSYLPNRKKPWFARIFHRGVQLHLGYYSNPQEAGIAYNVAAKELFGEFARLNPVPS